MSVSLFLVRMDWIFWWFKILIFTSSATPLKPNPIMLVVSINGLKLSKGIVYLNNFNSKLSDIGKFKGWDVKLIFSNSGSNL